MNEPAPLHPDMAAALRRSAELSLFAGDRNKLPVEQQRQLMEEERRWWNEEIPPFAQEWSFELPGTGRPVPVHAMAPDGVGADGPWIVWLHGGGWTVGSTHTHASLLRGLAQACQCTVFSVDYALAPEYPFPAPVEETVAVLRQLRARAAQYRVAPDAMAVGGDSSGSNVVLAAALELQRLEPGSVRAAISYYGVFDDDLTTGAAAAYGDGTYGLAVARMQAYWNFYTPDVLQRQDGRVNLCRAELGEAFPMYLMAAECDILRDGALRFAERLRAAGIAHQLSLRAGMGHAFMGYGRLIADVRTVHAEAAAFLQQHR